MRAEVFQVEEVLGDRDGQESLFGSKVGGMGREVCVRGLGSGG